MNIQETGATGIVREMLVPIDARSNVIVLSNIYTRDPNVLRPERDVPFRCRVRGAVALRDIVPVGIIDSMHGRHEIREIAGSNRQAAMDGTFPDGDFALLPEQIRELNAFRCSLCNRSTVSVWFENGKVQQKFVQQCMCRRPLQQEDAR